MLRLLRLSGALSDLGRPARPRWYRAWVLTLWSVLGFAATLLAWAVSGMLTGR